MSTHIMRETAEQVHAVIVDQVQPFVVAIIDAQDPVQRNRQLAGLLIGFDVVRSKLRLIATALGASDEFFEEVGKTTEKLMATMEAPTE